MKAIPFTAFCDKVLKLRLTEGQRVLCRVAFDGIDPADLEGAERETARQLFGDLERVSPGARRHLVLLLGRNSGKTTLACAFAIYLAVTSDVSACGPGDMAAVVVVAPKKRNANISIRVMSAMLQGSPDLAKLVVRETNLDGIELQRPDGRAVSIVSIAATRSGVGARGFSIIAGILDEAMFFGSGQIEGELAKSDRDVYSGLMGRLLSNGKIIFLSSLWPVACLMGELFEANYARGSTALAARAPTLVMRDNNPILKADIDAERMRDPGEAAREFDCDGSIGRGNNFFDLAALMQSLAAEPYSIPAGGLSFGGADFGFAQDSSACVVASNVAGRIYVHDPIEKRPAKGRPLVPSEVCAEFSVYCKARGATRLSSDVHYAQSISEHVTRAGIGWLPSPAGQGGKEKMYLAARDAIHAGKVVLPPHARLMTQMRAIQTRPLPGGGIAITHPRRPGQGHGDLASACVLAIFCAHRMTGGFPIRTFGKTRSNV
jgi:hypothetical protein